jgi:hypothetical protein
LFTVVGLIRSAPIDAHHTAMEAGFADHGGSIEEIVRWSTNKPIFLA